MIFRELNKEETVNFIEWAENNPPPDLDSWEVYHPVCREVWLKRGIMPMREEECLK